MLEMKSANRDQILDKVICISGSANGLRKGMDPSHQNLASTHCMTRFAGYGIDDPSSNPG